MSGWCCTSVKTEKPLNCTLGMGERYDMRIPCKQAVIEIKTRMGMPLVGDRPTHWSLIKAHSPPYVTDLLFPAMLASRQHDHGNFGSRPPFQQASS